MASNLEALINPGLFKGSRKNPEKLLVKFELYMEQMNNFFIATGKDTASDKVKLAVLQAVGGSDMVALVKHVGKVRLTERPEIPEVQAAQGVVAVARVEAVPADTFEQAVIKIRKGIQGQTNQAMAKFKLFKEMPQGSKNFAEWWPDVLEQAERCDWSDYNTERAARDAILYQTLNKKLKKKILAEDLSFQDACKFGVASEQLEKDIGRTEEDQHSQVRRLEEQLARVKGERQREGESKCSTCGRKDGHSEGYICPGLKVECFDCHKMGHFRKAPICKGSSKYKQEKLNKKDKAGATPRQKMVRQLSSSEESSETSFEDLGRIQVEIEEPVGRAATERKEEKVLVSVRPRTGRGKVGVSWTADSGVSKTLLAETDWLRMKKKSPNLKLRKNMIKFRPYGTSVRLPVMGKAKVVLKARAGAKINTTVYVVKDQEESLLGKKDGRRLGIITIDPEGLEEAIMQDELEEKVKNISTVTKQKVKEEGKISGNQTQKEIDEDMKKVIEKYESLFRGGIGVAKIDPIKIQVRPGVKPIAQRQRPVPLHYMKPLKEHIEMLLKEGIIEGPLGTEEATEGWVHNVVITAKGWDSSKIRMNLDTKQMADAVKNVHFPIPTPEQLRHQFLGSDRFTTVDMNHAFHQFKIDEESSKLFKFTTPFGLFKFRRLVMGTPPASGECHTKLAQITAGLMGVVQIKDDLVIHGKGKEHDTRLEVLLDRLVKFGLTLRPEKCRFGQQEVKWFGHVFSAQGMSPDPEKIKTITNWPEPENKEAVKSFLQTIQFVATYMRGYAGETLADITKPLRELTAIKAKFQWSEDCRRSFKKLKKLLASEQVMMNYDPARETRLYVDHGPNGVAAAVCQAYSEPGQPKQWRMVTHKSRSLTKAEQNYGKIEGESLGVLWGIKIHSMYLHGIKFEVIVDHLPLLAFYNNNNRPAPTRVERHRSKLRSFRFNMKYEPGKTTPCDYGSRHPDVLAKVTSEEKDNMGIEEEEEDCEIHVRRVVENSLPDAVTMTDLRNQMDRNVEMKQLMEDVKKGKLSKGMKQSEYAKAFEELTVEQGVLLRGQRLVIPPELQADCIALAHEGHQGESKTIQNLRSKVWFPRLAQMTKEFVGTCNTGCAAATSRNAPPPLEVRETPDGPWQLCAADYKGPIGGKDGYYFHVLMDTYSRWPEVTVTKNTSFRKLFPALNRSWARMGIPEIVIHDGGPPYNSSEWREYAKNTGFQSQLCTPYHPQANGMAEKFMASIVKMTHAAIAEKKDPKEEISKFLLNYRNTPHSSTGEAPSKLMMNRELRTKLPSLHLEASSEVHHRVKQKDREAKLHQKQYADKHRRAKEVEIKMGDKVLLKQDKTTLKPPFDPEPFTVISVQGSKVTAERDHKTKCRNQAKWKLLKDRPLHLFPNNTKRGEGNKTEEEDSDDESYIRVEALASHSSERNSHPNPPTQPEIPTSATHQASSPAQPQPQNAAPQPNSFTQPRPIGTAASQSTSRTGATEPSVIQGVPLQTGRPKRQPKPVQRYGAAEADQESTITDNNPKVKGKNPSPKERKKRKAEARKRDKTKREAWPAG